MCSLVFPSFQFSKVMERLNVEKVVLDLWLCLPGWEGSADQNVTRRFNWIKNHIQRIDRFVLIQWLFLHIQIRQLIHIYVIWIVATLLIYLKDWEEKVKPSDGEELGDRVALLQVSLQTPISEPFTKFSQNYFFENYFSTACEKPSLYMVNDHGINTMFDVNWNTHSVSWIWRIL